MRNYVINFLAVFSLVIINFSGKSWANKERFDMCWSQKDDFDTAWNKYAKGHLFGFSWGSDDTKKASQIQQDLKLSNTNLDVRTYLADLEKSRELMSQILTNIEKNYQNDRARIEKSEGWQYHKKMLNKIDQLKSCLNMP